MTSGLLTEHIVECCMCGAQVDTREEMDGGSPDGCELNGGEWVCSFECWDAAAQRLEG